MKTTINLDTTDKNNKKFLIGLVQFKTVVEDMKKIEKLVQEEKKRFFTECTNKNA